MSTLTPSKTRHIELGTHVTHSWDTAGIWVGPGKEPGQVETSFSDRGHVLYAPANAVAPTEQLRVNPDSPDVAVEGTEAFSWYPVVRGVTVFTDARRDKRQALDAAAVRLAVLEWHEADED